MQLVIHVLLITGKTGKTGTVRSLKDQMLLRID